MHLAVSLHAPNQTLRNEIVPSARAFHLDSIMDAMDKHINTPGPGSKRTQRGFIEYIVIHGVNDSQECAHQLGQILGKRNLIVNLIPYNASTADEMFKEPPEHQLQLFRSIIADYGFMCTVRRPHGRDIDGACGQLAVSVKNQGKGAGESADIEDLLPRGTGKMKVDKRKHQSSPKQNRPSTPETSEHRARTNIFLLYSVALAAFLVVSGMGVKRAASMRRH